MNRYIGDFMPAPTAALVGNIYFDVIENGVLVCSGGERTYFSDIAAATAHVAATIEKRKTEARQEREKREAHAADPLGGLLGSPAAIEKILEAVSAATGAPKEALQSLLRDRLGIDSWRAGEPPVG